MCDDSLCALDRVIEITEQMKEASVTSPPDSNPTLEENILEIHQLLASLLLKNQEGNMDSGQIRKLRLRLSKLLIELELAELALESGEDSQAIKTKIAGNVETLIRESLGI